MGSRLVSCTSSDCHAVPHLVCGSLCCHSTHADGHGKFHMLELPTIMVSSETARRFVTESPITASNVQPGKRCAACRRSFFPFFHRTSRVTSFSPRWCCSNPLDSIGPNIELKIELRARLSSLGPSPDRALCLYFARLTVHGDRGPRGADLDPANQPFATPIPRKLMRRPHRKLATKTCNGLKSHQCTHSAVPTLWAG